MKTLKRKADSTVEAIQYKHDAGSELSISSFAGDNVQFDHQGGICMTRGQPVRFNNKDWICKDAEGYFYVLADSLKQKLYDEVE